MFKDMMKTYQEINTLKDGVGFTKEGFDQLYKEFVRAEKINKIGENLGIVGGALIGISIGSLIMLSAVKRHYYDKD